MLRVFAPASLLVLVLLAGALPAQAAADVAVSAAVGPDGLADEGDPYFARATLEGAEAPREAKASDDCADARQDLSRSAMIAAGKVLAWDAEYLSISSFFPQCFGGNAGVPCTPVGVGCGAPVTLAYVSYDTTTGRYFAEVFVPDPATGLPVHPPLSLRTQQASSVAYTGTTGLSLQTDCETCPTPP